MLPASQHQGIRIAKLDPPAERGRVFHLYCIRVDRDRKAEPDFHQYPPVGLLNMAPGLAIMLITQSLRGPSRSKRSGGSQINEVHHADN